MNKGTTALKDEVSILFHSSVSNYQYPSRLIISEFLETFLLILFSS